MRLKSSAQAREDNLRTSAFRRRLQGARREGAGGSFPSLHPAGPSGVLSWPAPHLDVVLLLAVLMCVSGEAQGLSEYFQSASGGTLGGQEM